MCFFFLLSAWAVDIPMNTSNDIGVGCVARIQEKNPVLVLDEQQYSLRDDGNKPDESSSDGVFSVFVSTTSQKKAKAKLLGDDKKVLWSGDIPFPPKGQQTWLLIDEMQEGQRPLVEVKFKPIASIQGGKKEKTSWWLYWLMIGIGVMLGWYARRPTLPKIKRWTSTKNDDEVRLHIVDEERVLVEVIEQYARGMLTLLCTSKDRLHLFSDIAQNHTIFLMDEGIPCEQDSLFSQLSILETLGEAVLILDGFHGLVEPLPSEHFSSVLNEIISPSRHRVCAVFMRSDVPEGMEIPNISNETTTSQ